MQSWDHKPCAGISRISGGKTAGKRVKLTSKVLCKPYRISVRENWLLRFVMPEF